MEAPVKLMRNKRANIIILIIIVTLIAIYAGHFLFWKEEKVQLAVEKSVDITDSSAKSTPFPVVHKSLSTEINGRPQKINILEIDLSSEGLKIKPVLSHDLVYGFEKLSSIASRSNAYAAVNAGFFYQYGEPGGMVVINGKLITKSTGRYPVFIIDGKKAALEVIDTGIWISHGTNKIKAGSINSSGKPGEIVLYTPEFGLDNRANKLNTSVIIEDNKVKRIYRGDGACIIPENGKVLTFFEPLSFDLKAYPFSAGDPVKVSYEPEFGSDYQAYECGSWLVKEGKPAAVDRDEWVGVLTNRDPRTAVGIKHDGKVVLITVDGRQPGYSAGLSAKELADYLVDYGIKDAAMLDGGASTEMIVDGRIVNKPSFKGRERMLGGGIIVTID